MKLEIYKHIFNHCEAISRRLKIVFNFTFKRKFYLFLKRICTFDVFLACLLIVLAVLLLVCIVIWRIYLLQWLPNTQHKSYQPPNLRKGEVNRNKLISDATEISIKIAKTCLVDIKFLMHSSSHSSIFITVLKRRVVQTEQQWLQTEF